MTTNTAGSQARDYGKGMVHYIRKNVTYANNGTAVKVGTLPAGAQIIKPMSGVAVAVAFNAGTTNVIDIGTAATGDLYATDLALGAINFVPLDELVNMRVTVDTDIYATVQLTGTAATAGDGEVVVAYVPNY